MGSGLPEPLQWVLLFLAVVLGTFTLYEIVRRVNVLRFLLGMRMKPRRTPLDASPGALQVDPATVGAAGGGPRVTEGSI